MSRSAVVTIVFWFFFFQAEDGIRDVAVTGVQTCALPISWRVMVGLVLGFSGLVLLVGPGNLFPGSGGGGRVDPLGAIVLVLASLSWATGSIFSQHLKLPRYPLLVTAMQRLASGAFPHVEGLLTCQEIRMDW